MPSRGRQWLMNKKLRKLERCLQNEELQKQTTTESEAETRKQLGKKAKKRARLDGLQSEPGKTNTVDKEVRKKKSKESKKQDKQGAAPKPKMSSSDDKSADRDSSDFSGSGSGPRNGDRGWKMKEKQMQKGRSSHGFSRWGPPLHGHDSSQDGGFEVNRGHRGPQSSWGFDRGPSDMYTSFDHSWPDPRVPGSVFSDDRPPWEGSPRFQGVWGGNRPDFGNRGNQDCMPPPFAPRWGSGAGSDRDKYSWRRNSNSGDRESLSGGSSHGSANDRQRWDWDGGGNRDGSRWNRFARQFQDSHFHREDHSDTSSRGSDRVGMVRGVNMPDGEGQADSSGLDESGGSTGRKRSHSIEGEKRLSKSSRAEGDGVNSTVTSGTTNKPHAGMNGSIKQKPDSTSGKRIPHTVGSAPSQGFLPHSAAVSTTKPNGPAAKKKQFAESAKGLAAGVRPKSASGAIPPQSNSKPGEGILERAERMCKELREKRKQASEKQATLSSKQARSNQPALDDSTRSLESRKSFSVRGYLSDSNLPGSAGSSISGDGHSSGRVSVASHLSDVDRIRRDIESSVMAEGKAPKPRQSFAIRPAAVNAARRQSGPSSSAAASTSSSTTASGKPPLPQGLSKEALARMVNTPQSRVHRVQLARMLRAHTTTTARPRHTRLNLQLDGLYDGAGDNSVEDVLKDIGALEEIEVLGELKNIKLEDLTNEDKLRIAQLIEGADNDRADCDIEVINVDADFEQTGSLHERSSMKDRHVEHKQSRKDRPDTSATIVNLPEAVMDIDVPESPQRSRTASPNPNRPLSIDDLNVAHNTAPPGEKYTVDAMSQNPVRMARSPVRSSPSHPPAPSSHRDGSRTENAAVHVGLADTMQDDDAGAELSGQPRGSGSPQPPAAEAMDVSGPGLQGSLDSIIALGAQAGGSMTRQTGVLHEVLGLCQRQDSILAEMRGIDVQLSQLYKSLIEIVARMSSLQRRRVQLQGEGDQLSQQRNSLLTGIIPASHNSNGDNMQFEKDRGQHPHPASAARTSVASSDTTNISVVSDVHPASSVSSASLASSVTAQFGSSVTLPSWLTTASSNRRPAKGSGGNMEVPVPSESTPGSDVCLSGSVSSSVRSDTQTTVPQTTSRAEGPPQSGAIGISGMHSLGGSLSGSLPSLLSPSLSSRPLGSKRSSARESRSMLSLGDAGDDVTGNGKVGAGSATYGDISKDLTVSSLSSASVEGVGTGRQKDRGPMESSSGIGSSVTTHVSSTSHTQKAHSDASQSDHSTLQPDSDRGSLTNLSEGRNSARQRFDASADSLGSPERRGDLGERRQSTEFSGSSGVSVSYLGSISTNTPSELVQQIVRNLPLTSQLGEVSSPRSMSMYVLKPVADGVETRSPSLEDVRRGRSTSAEDADLSARSRSASFHSGLNLGAKLEVQDRTASADRLSRRSPPVVPKLDIPVSSEHTHTTGHTPRSESDANSIASSTSLGEQIKAMSERNSANTSAASLGFSFAPNGDDLEIQDVVNGKSLTPSLDLRDCSIVLRRLELDNVTPGFMDQADIEKPKKKLKSKKDRNRSVQHRRSYVVESSSEDPHSAAEEETLPDLVNVHKQLHFSRVPASSAADWELMEGDLGQDGRDLDSTLVNPTEMESPMHDEADDDENRTVSTSSLNPTRLRVNRENQKAFHASVRHNLNAAPGGADVMPDSSVETAEYCSEMYNTPAGVFKTSGPCAAVMGMELHGNYLYVCFQRHGIQRYTLSDTQDRMIYPGLETAQCFTLTSAGREGQLHLAVGCEDRVAFVSVSSGKELRRINTEMKVMCILVTESRLYAGLDCGAVMVINPLTMQEVQRFQASDCTVQCMAWTREGSTRLLCVADQNANILVIDAGNGLPVRSLLGHTRTAFALCMADYYVISGSGDRTVMAHDVHSAELVWKLNDHKGIVTSVCVDNGLLFTAGYDKIIHCYDFKSRRLLHLMYGAGKSVVMKMIIRNSVLYTGNRDGQIEAVDLRAMGSYTCGCSSCNMVFGLRSHLLYHLMTDHLIPNTRGVHCPWLGCSDLLNTGSSLSKAEEHMRSHIETR